MAAYKNILKKILILFMVAVFTAITIFYYNMYKYYHPDLLYVVQDNLDIFEAAKDKNMEGWELRKSLESSEIGEFKIGTKLYTLSEIFSWSDAGGASNKIVTFEYFRGRGGDNASLSYGIVYSPDESTLKEGLTHTWWNTIEYEYISIDENWYFVRRSYVNLVKSMFGIK